MVVASPVIVAEMSEWVSLGGTNLGIAADNYTNHPSGFHRAANEVPSTDYSRRRDPNGADGPFINWNYACAGDFAHNNNATLRAMHLDVLTRLMHGEFPMICEFIGKPWADQPVYYWARWNGITNLQKYTGSGHDRWSHISWYRSRVNERAHLWIKDSESSPIPPKPAPSTPVDDTHNWTEKIVNNLPVLRKGDRGTSVRRLQGLLIAAGSTDSKIDGDFGAATDRAVRREQSQFKLKIDGIVGKDTWTKLLGA